MEIRRLRDTAQLTSLTVEGDTIDYDFQDRQGGRFQQLVLPELESIGWEKLRRIP